MKKSRCSLCNLTDRCVNSYIISLWRNGWYLLSSSESQQIISEGQTSLNRSRWDQFLRESEKRTLLVWWGSHRGRWLSLTSPVVCRNKKPPPPDVAGPPGKRSPSEWEIRVGRGPRVARGILMEGFFIRTRRLVLTSLSTRQWSIRR